MHGATPGFVVRITELLVEANELCVTPPFDEVSHRRPACLVVKKELLWIPSAELPLLNAAIIGLIEVVAEFAS